MADIDIEQNILNVFKFINIKIVNNQQILINEIVKYIKENNYFGDKYHTYRNNQIESTKWWFNTFYEDNLNKIIEETIERNNLEIEKFSSVLI